MIEVMSMQSFEELQSERVESTLTRLRDWLTEHDWCFEELEDEGYIRTTVQGENARFRMVLGARGDGPTFLCFALYDFSVPKERRESVCALINLVNYTILLGCFEMDQEDGELRYRLTFPLDGVEIADRQIERSVVVAAMMADRFYPAFMALLYGGRSPDQALDSVDRPN